jgi:surfactin synthase thioesterase subunit
VSTAAPLVELDEETLWRRMSRWGGIPPEIGKQPAAMRLFSRLMRADLEIAASHLQDEPESVGCPVVALAGQEDPVFPTHLLAAWEEASVGGFSLQLLLGGHFYEHGLADLIPIVADDLALRLSARNVTASPLCSRLRSKSPAAS